MSTRWPAPGLADSRCFGIGPEPAKGGMRFALPPSGPITIQIYWLTEIWAGKKIHRHSEALMEFDDFDSHHPPPGLNE